MNFRGIRLFESADEWRHYRSMSATSSIGFVPTMGALHAGHSSLVTRSLIENEKTLVSIFVNPTQFNNNEDLEKYPRTLEQDLSLLSDLSQKSTESSREICVLLPTPEQVYADAYRYSLHESEISKILCGAHRPGHFEGVMTVVLKLLGIAQARACYMGEKDYQQFLIIKKMAEAFFINTQIVPCPIVREESGLAMSSRNTRLSQNGRKHAAHLFRVLSSKKTIPQMRHELSELGFQVEYLEEHWNRLFVAAWFENIRLIDNISLDNGA